MKRVYSDSLDEMVVKQFMYKGHLYVWNDIDCVYYDETEGDESFLWEMPTDEKPDKFMYKSDLNLITA